MEAVAVFPGSREVRIVNEPEPSQPGPSQVLIRIHEVGICGTDREIASHRYGLPPQAADHLILGHEALAQVVSVGPGVRSVAPGDWVVPMVRRPCAQARCRPCRGGRQDFCITGEYEERGVRALHGFMTRLVVEPEAILVRVPAALKDVAVLVEPLTIAAKAATQSRALASRLPWAPERLRGLVLGGGPVGLLGAMSMAARGVETFLYSREPASDQRAELARSFGATYVSGADFAPHELVARIGRVHVVFEAVGVASVVFDALAALGPAGQCVLSGIPAPGVPRTYDIDGLMRGLVLGNHVLVGTVNAGREAYVDAVEQLVKFMTLFPDSVHRLIGRRHPLADGPALLARRDGIKDVLAV